MLFFFFIFLVQISVLLYHGPHADRVNLVKKIRKTQGPLNMYPVVITSFEIAMRDRKYLQVDHLFGIFSHSVFMTVFWCPEQTCVRAGPLTCHPPTAVPVEVLDLRRGSQDKEPQLQAGAGPQDLPYGQQAAPLRHSPAEQPS